MSKKQMGQLKKALDYGWPEIQKQAAKEFDKKHNVQIDEDGREYYIDKNGKKVLVFNFDSWWLDRFDRKDVLFNLPGIAIMNTPDWQAGGASSCIHKTYDLKFSEACDDCFNKEHILAHIQRFPAGQYAAMRLSGPGAGHIVGMAVTMRTSRPPTAPVLPWREAIGDMYLGAHEPDGEWLYGVEMAVWYKGMGIGSHFYKARFLLARSLNLRGIYTVGMLMGYQDHAEKMTIQDYGEAVIAREIKDPTVTMQMNRGLLPRAVVPGYHDEPAAGDAGVLLVWENPEYEPGIAIR